MDFLWLICRAPPKETSLLDFHLRFWRCLPVGILWRSWSRFHPLSTISTILCFDHSIPLPMIGYIWIMRLLYPSTIHFPAWASAPAWPICRCPHLLRPDPTTALWWWLLDEDILFGSSTALLLALDRQLLSHPWSLLRFTPCIFVPQHGQAAQYFRQSIQRAGRRDSTMFHPTSSCSQWMSEWVQV